MGRRLFLISIFVFALSGSAHAQTGKIVSVVSRVGTKVVTFVFEHKTEFSLHLLAATVFEVGKSELGFAEPADCEAYGSKLLVCPEKVNPSLFFPQSTLAPTKLDPRSPQDRERVQSFLHEAQPNLDRLLHGQEITLPDASPSTVPAKPMRDVPEFDWRAARDRDFSGVLPVSPTPTVPPIVAPSIKPPSTVPWQSAVEPRWLRDAGPIKIPPATSAAPAPPAAASPATAAADPFRFTIPSPAPTAPPRPPPSTPSSADIKPFLTNPYSSNDFGWKPPAALAAPAPPASLMLSPSVTGRSGDFGTASLLAALGIRDFKLVNYSGDKFVSLAFKEPKDKDWSSVVPFTPVNTDSKQQVSFPGFLGPCHLDIKLTYGDGTDHVWSDIDFCHTQTMTIYYDRHTTGYMASWN